MHQLIYCDKTGRWLACDPDFDDVPMFCGDPFDINIAGHWVPCRLEMDIDWYILIEDERFRLHPKTKYQVILF